MHILFICDPIDKQKAGIYQFTLQMVTHIWKMNTKHKLSFVSLKSTLINNEIPAIPLPNTIPFLVNDPIRQFIKLPALIQKLNPDVVVEPAHFGPFNLRKNIKRITVIHDLTPIKFPELHPLSSPILHRIFIKRILKKADLIITNSKNTSQDVQEYCNSVALKTYDLALGKEAIFKPVQDKSVLQKYQITKPYLLSVGTLEPRKNLMTLLHAFEHFKSSTQSDMQLVLTGQNGWKNKKFEKLLAQHPFQKDILRTGYVDREDLPALYAQCEAFIYPSMYEGFGLPLLEAMACGAACLAARNSSLTEVGGNAVVYFETMDSNELSQKIEALVFDAKKQEEHQNKSLEQASKFSWEKYAQDFLALLDEKWGGQ